MSIVTMLTSFLGTMAGAGPWGIAAMVLGLGGVLGGVSYLIGKWNKSVDSGDMERSGADAGETAVDLNNQADNNRNFENRSRNDILKEGPPK